MSCSSRLIVLLLFAGMIALQASAQGTKDQPLKAFGTLLSTRTGYHNSRDSSRGFYEFVVYIQLRNDGDEPILILPLFDTFYLKRKIEFSEGIDLTDDRSKTRVVTIAPELPKILEDYDPKPGFLKRLDLLDPPHTVITIQPGMYYEFRDIFSVIDTTKRFESDKEIYAYLDGRQRQKFPSFTLEYSFSTKEVRLFDDFLSRLRSRWRRSGNLLLNGDGNFVLKTETIPGNRLSSS